MRFNNFSQEKFDKMIGKAIIYLRSKVNTEQDKYEAMLKNLLSNTVD